MNGSFELQEGSRLSEKHWVLLLGGEIRGQLTRAHAWSRTWQVEAAPARWTLAPAGQFTRGLVARDEAGKEVARYSRQRLNKHAIVLSDGRSLALERSRALQSERVLLDGERELARFRPRWWSRSIDIEMIPDSVQETHVMCVVLVCAILNIERKRRAARG